MTEIIGYINVFKRKTGFSIPVFKNSSGKRYIQDGYDPIEPEPKLMELDTYYFKLKTSEKITHDLSKEHISLFVYNGGKQYILIKQNTPFSLDRIPVKELNVNELAELEYVLKKKQIVNSFSLFLDFLNDYKNNGLTKRINLHSLLEIKDINHYQIRTFNIDMYGFWLENQEFIKRLLNDISKNKEVFLYIFYFSRFQTLSNSEVDNLFSIIKKSLSNKPDSDLLQQLYYLTLRNCNHTYLETILKIDFKNNSSSNLIIKSVFNDFRDLKKKNDQSIGYSIILFILVLTNLVKKKNSNYRKTISKTKMEALRNSLDPIYFKDEIQKIDSEILTLYSKDISVLLGYYVSTKKIRRREIKKPVMNA